jgi:hypothetical protein
MKLHEFLSKQMSTFMSSVVRWAWCSSWDQRHWYHFSLSRVVQDVLWWLSEEAHSQTVVSRGWPPCSMNSLVIDEVLINSVLAWALCTMYVLTKKGPWYVTDRLLTYVKKICNMSLKNRNNVFKICYLY